MNHELSRSIISAIQGVIGDSQVNLHEPEFKGNERKYLNDCIDSTYVSSVGEYVNLFENKLAEFTNANFAIATTNGTAALHLALVVAGVERGDEVLVPSLTFIATANAVAYCGASPHFVDVDTDSLGIDPIKLNEYLKNTTKLKDGKCTNKITGQPISALIPMHTFGYPAKMEAILEIGDTYKIQIIEDAAESLGSYYKAKHTGTLGKIGIISFNGNKVITTGGGGAILTNDKKIAELAKHLSTTAKVKHKWEFKHDSLGFNYRLPNLNAALGCGQLEVLQEKLENKAKLHQEYKFAFENIDGVNLFEGIPDTRSNHWLNVLILSKKTENILEETLRDLNDAGIASRPVWNPLHKNSTYKNSQHSDLSTTEELSGQIINIPSSPQLLSKS